MNRGRPLGTTKSKEIININMEEFKKDVLKGQSVIMISYKFKIPKKTVIDLCRKENLPCNTTGLFRFISKL